jgi:nitroimidazol reductase NimA-like FMN-containing flavoprotein (pyridoxamine 5'-phosphate oxidase superfamily)
MEADMSEYDQPVLSSDRGPGESKVLSELTTRDRVRRLLDQQPFAVLCTQGGGQPYGSVVAFAAGADLEAIVFATPVNTRKYQLLRDCNRVALVIDSRATVPDDMMKVEAVTATGQADELASGAAFEHWAAVLTARHPQLHAFVHSPSTALFRITVFRYLHVSRFQEVHQWIP